MEVSALSVACGRSGKVAVLLMACLLLALGALPVAAQEEQPPAGGFGTPGADDPAAAGSNAQEGPGAAPADAPAPDGGGDGGLSGGPTVIEPNPDNDLRVDIMPGDIEVMEFLSFLATNTGLPVIIDSSGQAFSGTITITAPVTNVDSDLVLAILEANRFEVFREKLDDGREYLRVESSAQPAGPGDAPKVTPVLSVKGGEIQHKTSGVEASTVIDLEPDQIATMVFTLNFTQPADAIQALNSLVAGGKPGTRSRAFSIVDVKNSMMVIITAKFGLLNYLTTLLTIIDVPVYEPERIVQIVEVEHADADELVQIIEQFLQGRAGGGLGARATTRTRAAQRRGAQPATTNPAAASQTPEGFETSLLADFRTNKIIVETYSESDLEDINMLVRELDVRFDSRRLRTHIYQVRFLRAEEVAADIQLLIGGGTGGLSGRSGLSRSRTQSRSRSVSRRNQRRGGTAVPTPGQAGGGGSQSQQVPALIVPHEATNSLMIQAEPEDFAEILHVLNEIDIKRRQVFLEAALVQVNSQSALNYTIELLAGDPDDQATRLLFESSFGLTGIDLQNFNRVIPDISNPGAVPPGGFLAIMDRGKFPALVNFLKTNNDSEVLATPFILADDNMQNIIEILETRFVQNTNTVNVSTVVSQEAEDAGITLDITPTITEDAVFLELQLVVSQFQDGGTPQLLPPKADNSITSAVTVPDGQIFVIGGLTRENRSKTVSKVPILGDIPLLGKLFRNETTSRSAANLYIFLRAHVLTHSEFLDGVDLTTQAMAAMSVYAPDLNPVNFHVPDVPREPPLPPDPDAPITFPLQPRSNGAGGRASIPAELRETYEGDAENPWVRDPAAVRPANGAPLAPPPGPSGDAAPPAGERPPPPPPRALRERGYEPDPTRESWLVPIRQKEQARAWRRAARNARHDWIVKAPGIK